LLLAGADHPQHQAIHYCCLREVSNGQVPIPRELLRSEHGLELLAQRDAQFHRGLLGEPGRAFFRSSIDFSSVFAICSAEPP